MVKAYVDGDVLVYELGFAAEASWRYWHADKGEEAIGPPPFEYVMEMMERRIPQIVAESGADEMLIFLTGKQNFRYFIAQTTPYKERVGNKPYHYKNIKAMIQFMFPCHLEEGLEADDLITLALAADPTGVAVSRDKDIRQMAGTHYSWELENQPAIGPYTTDAFGYITLKKPKVFGYGDKFLASQIITGDSTDSIPGCPKYGAVKAVSILGHCNTYAECLDAIIPVYQKCYGLDWKTVMREQARLVYLARRFNNGKVLLWDFPGEDETWMDVLTGQTFASHEGGEK